MQVLPCLPHLYHMLRQQTSSDLILHHEVAISSVLILESLRDAVGVVALPYLSDQVVSA